MGAAALEYAYQYPFPSELRSVGGRPDLRLATCGGKQRHPHFFKGKLIQPRRTADLLLALSLVSRTRFFMPKAHLLAADPIVTSGGARLRFEAFSVCCGVYARVDLHPEAIDGEWVTNGTTNVDFNPPMRAALARLPSLEPAGLNVGADSVELESTRGNVVEKKVPLPVRWLKGLVEVQAYQSRMKPAFEIPAAEARRFFAGLPRQVPVGPPAFVAPSGPGIRLSQRESAGAVAVGGPERLKVLEELTRHARTIRIYGGADGVSGWELVLNESRFHFVLSPEVTRGFSGEGQALSHLAGADQDSAVPQVRAALQWQSKIDAPALAHSVQRPKEQIAAALAALGSRGLVGFDLDEGAYFHRELPFDMELVDELQPRLVDAKKLVAENGVRFISRTAGKAEAYVRGTDVEHRVREAEDVFRCTCPWFSKNQGTRGPCKHILAVQLLLDTE